MSMGYDRRAAAPEESPAEDVGELEVAEWVVFVLAYDTYFRHLKETTGLHDPMDPVLRRGLRLLQQANSQNGDAFHAFLMEHMPTESRKKMLAKVFRFGTSRQGLPRQALQLRFVLNTTGIIRKVFKAARAIREVNTAIQASYDAGSEAMGKIGTLTIRNARIRAWVDLAAKVASSGEVQSAVDAATLATVDDRQDLAVDHAKRVSGAPASVEAHQADQDHSDRLAVIQQSAQEAAKRALDVSGEPDVAPTKSEVVGIAMAAAAAVVAADNPAIDQALTVGGYPLDSEQRAAALTDGLVLVAAGAGAGKSTTLVGRLKYLINVKHASPSRMLVATFNRKAGDDLKESIAKELGANVRDSLAVGTMHSLFRRFIRGARGGSGGFGTESEKAMVSDENLIRKDDDKKGEEQQYVTDSGESMEGSQRRRQPPPPTGRQMTHAVRGIMRDIGASGLSTMTGLPEQLFKNNPDFSAKTSKQWMENWRGNDVESFTALSGSQTVEEVYGAVWMRIYHGIKGDLDTPQRRWEPAAPSNTFGTFMKKFRPAPDYRRLGDADDMVRIFRDILRRDGEARKTAQRMFDHVLVDEAQDLNLVQHQIFEAMTEGFDQGGKSFWIVGDDKQSIYQFRSAQPKLFTAKNTAEKWQTRLIQTNYRCDPEIVEAANKLTSFNKDQIPMEARADPKKPRNHASIEVTTPPDYVDAAYDVISTFSKDKQLSGESWGKGYAVLSRTNSELDAFEDQCILHEIPYYRSKGKGFLESAESNVVMGYFDLAMSSDYQEMQDALVRAITKPDRGIYLSSEAVEKIVRDAYKSIASQEGTDVRSLNPLDLLTRPSMARKLARAIKEPQREMKIARARAMEQKFGPAGWLREKMRQHGYEWMFMEDVDDLTQKLIDMGKDVLDLRRLVKAGGSTTDTLNRIMDGVKTEVGYYNKRTGQDTRKTISLRQAIKEDVAFNRNPDEDDAPSKVEKRIIIDEKGVRQEVDVDIETGEPVDPLAGLGTVRYLYQLAEQNENDKVLGVDPSKGEDFYRKIDRYKTISKELQDPKKNPDRMALSTIHSVKGAQWRHVALCMSPGFFPVQRKSESTDLQNELDKVNAKVPWNGREEAIQKAHSHMEDPMVAERNLAYVGVTRAKEDLMVICSQQRVNRKSGMDGPVLGQFVVEAGLKRGQNVAPADVAAPAAPEPTPVPPESGKTAAWAFDHEEEDSTNYFLDDSYSYNRGQP